MAGRREGQLLAQKAQDRGGIITPFCRPGAGAGAERTRRVMARRNQSPPPAGPTPTGSRDHLCRLLFQPEVSTVCRHPGPPKGASLELPSGQLPRSSPPENGAGEKLQAGERISKAVWGQRRACIRVGEILFLRGPRLAPAHTRSRTGPAHGLGLKEKLEAGIWM